MGKASRDKGARYERHCVHRLQDEGFAAERIPLSGAAGGSFAGDITFPLMGEDRRAECKKRARGFSQLYQWLEDHYCLFAAADRADDLVVLRLSDFITIAKQAERRKDA